jgi:hypothetical protein
MYVADAVKMRKVNIDGEDSAWGIAPSNDAPTLYLGRRSYKTISDFEATTESSVAWTNGGVAGAITAPDRITAIAVSEILYDGGASLWASVVPASFPDDFQVGMLITTGVTTAETTIIEAIFNPVFDTAIESIAYDSGSTGLCTIQLSVPTYGLARDAVVKLGGSELVRVLSVTLGRDDIPSFRCSTVGTFSSGASVAGKRSFRAQFVNTHDATTTLSAKMFASTASGEGIGYLTHVVARDLSNTGNRPITGRDYIHISFRVSNLTNFTEGKIMLDVDGSTNDFTRNYYYHAFRANDLTPSTTGDLTSLAVSQQVIQRTQIDSTVSSDIINRYGYYTDGSGQTILTAYPTSDVYQDPVIEPIAITQTTTGDAQWTELMIPVSELQRVGADMSRSLHDVKAVRIWFNVAAALTVNVDSWWIGGTYGPDIDPETDGYLYCFRPRSKVTGAKGNPSPATRFMVRPRRQQVFLTGTQHPDPQVDSIDWFRTGGSLQNWHYVGTSPNDPTPTFTDEFPDYEVVQNPILEFDNFQPFPVKDVPKSGVCNVIGTRVEWVSGDAFDVRWAKGSIVVIDGLAYALYSSPTSATVLEIEYSAGSKAAVSFELPAATLLAEPIQTVWGPYGAGFTGVFMFACRQGTLYWTKGNEPDSAPDANYLEVTSGSEVLVNGCSYDGNPYVFSDERQYKVTPIQDSEGRITFQVQEVANSKGLAAKFGVTVGDKIYFIGKDGIYSAEGSAQPVSITDNDLYPLFPHDGIAGSSTAGIEAPSYDFSDAMRLEYSDKFLYFNYRDSDNVGRTLVYDTRHGAWYEDAYTPAIIGHYAIEADGSHGTIAVGANGSLYTLEKDSTTDNGTAIGCQVRTAALSMGDTRADKRFSEILVDYSSEGQSISAIVAYNNYQTTTSATTLSNLMRGQTVINLGSGFGTQARNITLDLTWNGRTSLFEWQPAFYLEPENTTLRVADWQDGGYPGAKWLQGLRIQCDTGGQLKVVEVHGDNDAEIATLTLNSTGDEIVVKSWPPAITHFMRLVPKTPGSWKEYSREWVFEPEPELARVWTTQPTTHDLPGYVHLRDAFISLRSTDVVNFTVTIDGVPYQYAIPSTGGDQRKIYISFRPAKGKEYEYSFESCDPFRLYKRDCEIRAKAWGEEGGYHVINPFGDQHRADGARI